MAAFETKPIADYSIVNISTGAKAEIFQVSAPA